MNKKERRSTWQGNMLLYTGAFALVIFLLLLSIYIFFFNPHYYNYLFKHFDVRSDLGVSASDLKLVRNNIISYFMLFKTSLQTSVTIDGAPRLFYTSDEIMHMGDVRTIFEAFLFFFMLAGTLFEFALRYFIQNRNDKYRRKHTGIALITAASTIVLLFVPIIVAILVDFDQFFTFFHTIFFPGGNWQFDNDSLMLMLLTEGLFLKGVLHIALAWTVSVLLVLSAGIIILCRHKKVSKK